MHASYLQKALQLAELKRGFTAPNPAVGALVVKNNKIIGQGFHEKTGEAHAEVNALADLTQAQTRGATLYVTLEPCCHFGKTPPCTDLIIERGIKKVIYAYPDPNPCVNGKGHEKLLKAGIATLQINYDPINTFYESYHHFVTTKTPLVTAKLALSLDGKIALSGGKPAIISGEKAKEFTHFKRKQADAILTTVKTILADNPQLNARNKEKIFKKPVYVLDKRLEFPLNAALNKTAAKIILLHQVEIETEKKLKFIEAGIELREISLLEKQLDLMDVIKHIGQDGVHDLWIEVGGICFQGLLQQKLLNRAFIYVAPRILGENAYSAFSDVCDIAKIAKEMKWSSLAEDALCCLTF